MLLNSKCEGRCRGCSCKSTAGKSEFFWSLFAHLSFKELLNTCSSH